VFIEILVYNINEDVMIDFGVKSTIFFLQIE
jgi:hypothetical protein